MFILSRGQQTICCRFKVVMVRHGHGANNLKSDDVDRTYFLIFKMHAVTKIEIVILQSSPFERREHWSEVSQVGVVSCHPRIS